MNLLKALLDAGLIKLKLLAIHLKIALLALLLKLKIKLDELLKKKA